MSRVSRNLRFGLTDGSLNLRFLEREREIYGQLNVQSKIEIFV